MTLADVDWPATLTALTGVIAAVTAGAVAIIREVRRSGERTRKEIREQLDTGNGTTIGQAVEQTHKAVVNGSTPEQAAREIRGDAVKGE